MQPFGDDAGFKVWSEWVDTLTPVQTLVLMDGMVYIGMQMLITLRKRLDGE